MEIAKTTEAGKTTLALTGRLDTNTAPQLETIIRNDLGGVSELVFDFKKLEYISSAGLRVILSAQKTMNAQG
ncbi:MAG: STAS domain-containing protein, partial [Firmicutes bacterium]|nr:STAS domain-containing protein [Candidatus Colimorpha enterica]